MVSDYDFAGGLFAAWSGGGSCTISTTMSVLRSITPQVNVEMDYSMIHALFYDPGVCSIISMCLCLSSCGLEFSLLDILWVSRPGLQHKDGACRIRIVSHLFKPKRTF